MSLASECFTRAGECYERGEAFVKAGKSFEEAKHYNAAALSYHRHRSTIDDAVRLATDLGLEIEEKIRGDIIQVRRVGPFSRISSPSSPSSPSSLRRRGRRSTFQTSLLLRELYNPLLSLPSRTNSRFVAFLSGKRTPFRLCGRRDRLHGRLR